MALALAFDHAAKDIGQYEFVIRSPMTKMNAFHKSAV